MERQWQAERHRLRGLLFPRLDLSGAEFRRVRQVATSADERQLERLDRIDAEDSHIELRFSRQASDAEAARPVAPGWLGRPDADLHLPRLAARRPPSILSLRDRLHHETRSWRGRRGSSMRDGGDVADDA